MQIKGWGKNLHVWGVCWGVCWGVGLCVWGGVKLGGDKIPSPYLEARRVSGAAATNFEALRTELADASNDETKVLRGRNRREYREA